MKKTMSILAIAGLILALAPATQAALPAWTDSIVGGYRIAFITAGNYVTDQPNIATYDGYVQAEAQAVGSLVSDITDWKVIGTTAGLNGRSHTGTVGSGGANDVPIYDVNGVMIALGNEHFWGTTPAGYLTSNAQSLLTPLNYQPDGTKNGGDRVFTGMWADGTPHATAALGQATVVDGDQRQVGSEMFDRGGHIVANDYNGGKPLFAMSGVIPEPATMSLLAIGGIALLRRKRRA